MLLLDNQYPASARVRGRFVLGGLCNKWLCGRKAPHPDGNVWEGDSSSVSIFSPVLPLCVRVNFLTGRYIALPVKSKSDPFALNFLYYSVSLNKWKNILTTALVMNVWGGLNWQ